MISLCIIYALFILAIFTKLVYSPFVMPITKSAKKALRSSGKKRYFNTVKKDEINKALKQVKKLISEKKLKEAKEFLPKVQKILDKSVKTGLIKANKSSRKKSRIVALLKRS